MWAQFSLSLPPGHQPSGMEGPQHGGQTVTLLGQWGLAQVLLLGQPLLCPNLMFLSHFNVLVAAP